MARRVFWAPSDAPTPGTPAPWHIDRLNIRHVWETTRGAGVAVAVIDSGVAAVPGLDDGRIQYLDAAGDPIDPSDTDGHGTACACLIGSSSRAVPGIAPAAQILSLQVTGLAGPLLSKVERALDVAAERADVISCSFVLPQVSNRIVESVRRAHIRGAIVLGAAGNDDTAASPFPEQTPHVFTVAATGRDDRALPGDRLGAWIDAAAPGEDLLTRDTEGGRVSWPGKTSGATALVAGVCALMLSVAETAADRARLGLALDGLIKSSASNAAAPNPAVGHGIVDPIALLQLTQNFLEA